MAIEWSLAGKTAVITGSNSGIGLGIAQQLAKAGADVVLNSFTDRDEDHTLASEIAEEYGVTARYIKADMSKGDECRMLIEKAGRCDILVNNAGIQHVAPIDEFPMEKWDAIIAINMNSAFPHHRRSAAGDARSVLGASDQCGLGPWFDRVSVQIGLCCGKTRCGWHVQSHRAGNRRGTHHLQCGVSRLCADPAGRSADPRYYGQIQYGPRRGDQKSHAGTPAQPRVCYS